MKIFMLGGYGAVGMPAARLLVENELVSRVTLAGRHLEKARQAAAQLGAKANAVAVDAADETQLASAVAGYDVVLNLVGNQVARATLQAAIRSGASYCDVGWDWAFVDDMQTLTDEARDAGITAILCNGISPCLTNLMGVHAAAQLDQIEQLQGGRSWLFVNAISLTPAQWPDDPEQGLATLGRQRGFLEWALQLVREKGGRTVRAYRDGQWVDEDPTRSGVAAPRSNGNTVSVFPYLAMDPFFGELPRDISKESVGLWFTPFPRPLQDLFREQAMRVAASESDPAGALKAFFARVESDPAGWLTPPADYEPLSPDWVVAVGHKDGRPARFSCWLAPANWSDHSGWLLTSIPLVVTTLAILRGDVQQRGVLTAEKAFDPSRYFADVATLYSELPPGSGLIEESFAWLS
jgi:hypothetical protein